MVEWVSRGTNRRAVGVGDLLEGITPRDKRFEYGDHKLTVTEQCAIAKKRLYRIRRKILGLGRGNHETSIKSHGDIIKDVLCADLRVPYGTSSFKLLVHDSKTDKLMYKAFATHYHSGSIGSTNPDPIMRKASEQSQVKRKLSRERMADCILNMAAHFHKAIVVKPHQELYLVDDGEKIKQRYVAEADPTAEYIDENLRWYGSIPGWIKKYLLGTDGYVERTGYDPLPIGFIKTTVRGGKLVDMEKVLV
jgi:hypothetical protein